VSMDTAKDYRDLISRYQSFKNYTEEIQSMLTEAVNLNRTNHERSMSGVLDQIKAHLVDYKETIFWEPFEGKMNNVTDEEAKILKTAAKEAIETSVQEGFTNLHTFLESTYMTNLRQDIGVSSLPDGKAFYLACLAFHTSDNVSSYAPHLIHQAGLDEVERIEEEMRKILVELGHEDLTLAEFADMVRKNASNFFSSPEELLEEFHNIIENQIQPRLAYIVRNVPKIELEILEATNPNSPAAFYIAGAADGSRPGRLFVNTAKYGSQPRYTMVSLSLHETNPGHHLQSSFMLEKEDWPQFRKMMEDRIYNQVPSRFPINTAYVEGWGLYSESLGFDMELYNDPMQRYGHYGEEIFRACRLVVDTGMHSLGWSRDMAVQYMVNHTVESSENIEQEIDRYITWPGQATAYKIGQMMIKKQRQKAEEALDDKFDLRDFHEVVLRSVGPLNILEKQVDKFIMEKSGARQLVTNWAGVFLPLAVVLILHHYYG